MAIGHGNRWVGLAYHIGKMIGVRPMASRTFTTPSEQRIGCVRQSTVRTHERPAMKGLGMKVARAKRT